MKTAHQIGKKIMFAKQRRNVLLSYREHCTREQDHHGVQDACSDLRECETEIATLRWMLGGNGNGNASHNETQAKV